VTEPIKKITSLTPEQEKLLDVIREKWLAFGLSTQPANRAVAEDGIRDAYVSAGLRPPKHIIWVDSPYAGALALGIVPQAIDAAMALVQDTVKDVVSGLKRSEHPRNLSPLGIDNEAVRDWWRNSTYGQHSAGYYAYLDAMMQIGVTGLEAILGSMAVAQNAGWWWPADEFVIVTERPSEMHRDPQQRLHNSDGAAILYPDGWGVYVWHGTRVPKALIEGKWSAEDILRETNTEVRRCAIEKMGWENFVIQGRFQEVHSAADPGNPGYTLHLFDVPQQIFNEPIRVLVCTNATPERDGTRRKFGLTVPANIDTATAAAAWGFGLDEKQYLTMARAC
jgi:hypothetical protein